MNELRNELRSHARKEAGMAELGTATIKVDVDMTALDKACDRIEQRLDKLRQKIDEVTQASKDTTEVA